jgi:glycine dehydrogenase subunit 2
MTMADANRTTQHIALEESLLFEKSRPGRIGYSLPPTGVPELPLEDLVPAHLYRERVEGLPELSETDVVRHFNRLAQWNYCIDRGIYPLGSCTMKYNPRLNEDIARWTAFTEAHPYLPDELVQGCLAVQWHLERYLCEITGMDAATLQPAAGAHGELTGLLLIRAYLEERGEKRTRVLVPDSAHGTNPASAALGGFEVVHLRSDERGLLSPSTLRAAMSRDVAALMITNPNTLGLFEEDILEIADILHEAGAFLYMDGANMNALVGVARPGDMGVDVLHLNLHKTFSTPHGSGGPGSGPVCVKAPLAPYLPVPRVFRDGDRYYRVWESPRSIGRVKAFQGHFGVHVRALAYILSFGRDHLRDIAIHAVLNANYLRARLKPYYHLPYDRRVMHEVVFNDRRQNPSGVTTMDIAKRLIDYGLHPPTVYFPLIVPGALMIEPTETESIEELDRFAEAMIQIAREAAEQPEVVRSAPHRSAFGRFDEVEAARHPVLRWSPHGFPPPRKEPPKESV